MRHNKSSLFLMEIIVAILFFSLASAICIQLFVSSHLINEKSTIKNKASRYASSIAEVYQNHQLEDVYHIDHNYIYLDKDFYETSKNKSIYQIHLTQKEMTLNIEINKEKEKIYSLAVKSYQQKEVVS